MVSIVNDTLVPPGPVMPVSNPVVDRRGNIAWRPFAPLAWLTAKFSTVPFQLNPLKEELLRPSSQFNIWTLETTGIPRESAEDTTASETGLVALSVCAFTVYTP